MVKAEIKTKNGTRIQIEGTPEEIEKILADIKRREEQLAVKKKSKISATDFILKLREEGFFDKPKSILEIKEKLAENGLVYPVTTLSGVLLRLVRRKELGRIKIEKMWGYVKR
ncbi:MAG: hypothetical protein OH319_03525 [Candidatus Parvarchaeota archaeon]|nr:hypothetical protein [Candidatus Jingweiarchaeum tengchongense]MCW1304575.1 hypothetical protein [Candidatus Jingweiarchaeum tengchongense]MCW1310247.1 hypothetical protein [Candidatus Jingweiarchaeum tengchongense]